MTVHTDAPTHRARDRGTLPPDTILSHDLRLKDITDDVTRPLGRFPNKWWWDRRC